MRFLTLALLFCCFVPLAQAEPHDPILIRGNSDFLWPLNGVTAGSGTLEDPYIISGWEIEAPKENWGTAIKFYDTDAYVIVRDVTLTGSTGFDDYGVVAQSSSNIRLHNSEINELRHGFNANGGTNYEIIQTTMNGAFGSEGQSVVNGELAIQVFDGSNTVVDGVTIKGYDNGVQITDGYVQNSLIEANSGIFLRGLGVVSGNTVIANNGIQAVADGVIIENNWISGGSNPSNGIWFGSENIRAEGALIRNNVVDEMRQGISLKNTKNVVVKNNLVERSSLSGGDFRDAVGLMVKGNKFSNGTLTHQFGAVYCEACHDFNISKNLIQFNKHSGVELDGSNNGTIWNNAITDNGDPEMQKQYGIIIKGNDNVISGNKIFRNHALGIFVEDGMQNQIFANQFKENTEGDVGLDRMDGTDNDVESKESPSYAWPVLLVFLALLRRRQ